jgi:3-dehydroquinate synthase
MKTVRVEASVSYDVIIGQGLISRIGEIVKEQLGLCKICIITDDTVDALYGEKTVKSFTEFGYDVEKIVIPHGEQSKNATNLFDIVNKLAEMRFTRKDMLVALGGGVVGDLTGFCAATYMRGIRFVQVPTTLLAAVDSSVGGKTAVDLPAGKNLFGAFWQPSLVICDTDTLDTLSKEIYADGTAEIIKYGMICDCQLFETVSKGAWDREKVISRCVELKRDVVNRDEFENGLRQILNYGHTFGHAVETLSNFNLTHGTCVAIGMCMICRALVKKGEMDNSVYEKLKNSLKNNNLPTEYECDTNELFEIVGGDKKRAGNAINLIVVKNIGEAEIIKMELDEIKRLIEIGMN